MKCFIILALLFAAANAWNGYTCAVEIGETLATVSPPLKFNAPGLPNSLACSPSYFDVIAFNAFSANTGDVEGSLLCKKFNVGNGFSVGAGINPSSHFIYPLVIDGNGTFGSGDVTPSGNDIYVSGKSFQAPSYLSSRVVPTSFSPAGTSGSYGFGPCWTLANTWYNSLAADLNGQPQTVTWMIQYNTLHITGLVGALNHGTYILNIDAASFNTINAYSFDTAVPTNNGGLTIVVKGNAGFTASFNGGQVPAGIFTYVNYSFYKASTITVNTGVYGSILAPTSTVNQVGGVIWGKVVANNINCLQINRPICLTSIHH